MTMKIEIAIESGKTRCALDSELATSTARAASVAYATDEIGSDEKTGSARNFGRSVVEVARRSRPADQEPFRAGELDHASRCSRRTRQRACFRTYLASSPVAARAGR